MSNTWEIFEEDLHDVIKVYKADGLTIEKIEVSQKTMDDWVVYRSYVYGSSILSVVTFDEVPIKINNNLTYRKFLLTSYESSPEEYSKESYNSCRTCNTPNKCKVCYKDMYKHHPSKFLEDFFGIKLLDYQKWLLDEYYG